MMKMVLQSFVAFMCGMCLHACIKEEMCWEYCWWCFVCGVKDHGAVEDFRSGEYEM